jgi:osmoprotectant transport system ATP-binding protein
MGALFDPQTDTLRVALDSALTSPVGLAVAVNRGTGRYLGVVGADEILTQLADARAAPAAPAGSVSEPDSTDRGADPGASAMSPGGESSTPAAEGSASR